MNTRGVEIKVEEVAMRWASQTVSDEERDALDAALHATEGLGEDDLSTKNMRRAMFVLLIVAALVIGLGVIKPALENGGSFL